MGARLADPARLAIRGGSAGGFTTLAALTTTDVFAAGVSQYGIADLEAMATDTHKFEARYLDSLVGRYPEERAIYTERSPIHHLDQLGTHPAAAGDGGQGGAADAGLRCWPRQRAETPASCLDHVRRRRSRFP